MIVADLHSHTRASDGSLEASHLLEIAQARGVNLFAITDHDTVASVAAGRAAAAARGVGFVAGVEISANWQSLPIHVVGLNIDEFHAPLLDALQGTRDMRLLRAKAMGESLAAAGIEGAFEGASALATNPELVSRTHFARHLVQSGVCGTNGEVFSRYMKPGKPGYVVSEWMALEAAISLIHGAGGSAILAHPARYDTAALGGTDALVSGFKKSGGDAIEVVCAGHSPSDWANYAALSRRYELKASIGSDFHSHAESKVRIGDLPRLSPSLVPVWSDWAITESLFSAHRK